MSPRKTRSNPDRVAEDSKSGSPQLGGSWRHDCLEGGHQPSKTSGRRVNPNVSSPLSTVCIYSDGMPPVRDQKTFIAMPSPAHC